MIKFINFSRLGRKNSNYLCAVLQTAHKSLIFLVFELGILRFTNMLNEVFQIIQQSANKSIELSYIYYLFQNVF